MLETPGADWEDAADFTDPPKSAARHNEGIARIQKLQQACQHATGRSFHSKQLLGAFGELTVRGGLPEFCRHGPFAVPGTKYRAAMRFSNAQGCPMSDLVPDIRGLAIKFLYRGEEVDLVMTNIPTSVTPDADQFMQFGDAYAEGAGRPLPVHIAKLLWGVARRQRFGAAVSNLWRMTTGILPPVRSAAAEHYWGAAVKLGRHVAKYTVQPARGVPFLWINPFRPDYLTIDLMRRAERGGLTFRLGLQFFLDRRRTPLHVAHTKWRGPIYWVADISIPARSLRAGDAGRIAREIDRMPFNPTHWFDGVVTDFQASRGEAYRASQKNRGASSLRDYAHYFEAGDDWSPRR